MASLTERLKKRDGARRRGPWSLYWVQQFNLRRTNLIRLGFASYPEYLASGLWKSIRAGVLAASPACGASKNCRSAASEVHHRAYDLFTLRGTSKRKLTPVCRYHHERYTAKSHDVVS